MIPFSPPFIDDDIISEVVATLKSGWITTGKQVRELEQNIGAFCGIENVLAVNSATSALMLTLHWYGVRRGDEVIVPAYTYCATALAVMHLGAKPVMVDVEEDFNISPEKIEKAITDRTKAIITVDIGGWPCNYNFISNILNKAEVKNKFVPSSKIQNKLGRILFISDAAHSLGAIYNNKRIGTQADITVFSLHAVKNLTTAEGGVICVNMPHPFNNNEIYKTLRLWSLNGQTKDAFTKTKSGEWRYDIVYPGFKINMPDVLAAIGLAQLKKYDTLILKERKRIFDFYAAAFKKYSWAICPPFQKEGCVSSFHLYPLRIKGIDEEQRNKIIQKISEKNVSVNVHFIPLPMLTIFRNAGYAIENFPVSYAQYCNEISLPIYPQLADKQCKIVVDAVVKSVEQILHKGLVLTA
jgi:dTDP-4-amino-4,6-dideoxygalactose transaminase